VASTAPAYSLAASLGYVVLVANGDGIVGVKAPSIMLLAFLPMYFVAVAYSELNKAEPDCGTTFTWAARAFGPKAGWMGGWGLIAADIIVMNLAQIAYSYTFAPSGSTTLLPAPCGFSGRVFDRDHDLHLLSRARALGPDPVMPARYRVVGAGDLIYALIRVYGPIHHRIPSSRACPGSGRRD
jgi:amino acid transporter